MSARNTIVLKGEIERRYDEGVAGGSIKPGHLIQANASEAYVVHNTAGGPAEFLVAVEDDFRGMTVQGDLPSDGVVSGGLGIGYVTNDKVRFHIAQSGDVLQMILAAGQTVTPNSYMTSNGDGRVKVASGSDTRLGKFNEVLDLSGGGAVDTFVKVRKL